MELNLVFLVSFILVLIIIVELSAIALKITGMDLHKARFQALSALVTVGYTTSDSEMVVRHPARRRIIMVLMILGYLGTATIVTALISIMRHPVTLLQVAIAVVIILLPISLMSSSRFRTSLDRGIERQLTRHKALQKRSVEEVLRLDRRYGVSEVTLEKGNLLIGQSIAASKIRDKELFILAIDRKDSFIHSPRGEQVLYQGDKLIVYGKLINAYEIMCQKCTRDLDI
nr:TrkA C-terminal domain-containing protein [Desulforamulus aquiferis]